MLGVKLERLTLFLGPIQFQVYTFMRKMSLKVLFSQIRSIYTFRKHVSQEVVFYPFKRKIKSYLGITLLELLIVLTILALLMSIAIPSYNEAKNKSQVAKAIGDIKYLEKKILLYVSKHGKCPDSLDDIGEGDRLDPWGHPYRYLNFANTKGKGKMRKDRFLVPLNSDYDLYSVGRDGKTATPLNAQISYDDIVRANDGGFVGLGKDY